MSYEEELLHLECAKLWRENERLSVLVDHYERLFKGLRDPLITSYGDPGESLL